jgi:membrane protein implicated in regulation of membrane protease activity
MAWWGWMVIGALLFGAEMFAIDAQFYLVFLGVSALLVGVASLLGIEMALWVQIAAFSVLSLVFFFTFRKSLYEKIRGGAIGFRESISGDSVTIKDVLKPGAEARAEHRGTQWTVRNVGNEDIAAGSRAQVVKVEGLTLHVSKQ